MAEPETYPLAVDVDEPHIKILGERDGGMVDAMVPIELICREDVPVDEAHVAELVASMRLEAERGMGTGQLSPVLLGDVAGQDKLLIIDGFHRDASLYRLGAPEIFASVRTGSSLEDVIDLRILTANTHSSVTFARINEWITDAWSRSQWSEKMTVVQAFAIANALNTGKRLGLTVQELESISSWVADKCEKWRMSSSTVHQGLMVAEVADPGLVKAARRRSGGRELVEVTPQHLGVIARGLPNRHDIQRLAAGIATRYNLTVPLTRAAVELLKDCASLEDAQRLAAEVDWQSVEPAFSKSHTRELAKRGGVATGPATATSGETMWLNTSSNRKLIVSELELSRLALTVQVLRGAYTAPLTADVRPSLVTVKVTDDDQISALLDHADVSKNTALFYEAADVNAAKILAILQGGKYDFDEKTAKEILRAGSTRVVQDIEAGDLRFVDLERPQAAYDLLVKCTLDEIKRRDTRSAAIRNAAQHLVSVGTLELSDMIRFVGQMSDKERRAVIAHGLLGLSVVTTADVIGIPAPDAPNRIRDGFVVLERARQKRLHKMPA